MAQRIFTDKLLSEHFKNTNVGAMAEFQRKIRMKKKASH
jgi:hypothetical protein